MGVRGYPLATHDHHHAYTRPYAATD